MTRLPRYSLALAGLVVVFLANCAGPEALERWTTTVDTLPSGAVHVVNNPPSTLPPPTWTIEEEARIGTATGPGPTSFGQLKGLVVTPAGEIVVLDAQAEELRIFGADGSPLSTFGGQGEGPGELARAWGVMLAPDGTLWVPELGNGRMSVFHPHEGFLRSYPLSVLSFKFLWDGVLDQDGRMLKPSITLGPPRRRLLRVYGPGMELVDSLPLPEATPANPKDVPGSFYFESPEGLPGYAGVPFYARAQEVLDPRGGMWSTDEGDPSYRIKHWVPGGDTTLVLEALRAPVAIAPEVRDSAIASVRSFLQQRGGARQDWSKVPRVRPAVGWMFLSEEGNLWVATPSADTLSSFDVFDRGGRYLGTAVSSLKRFWPVLPVVREDRFWAVVLDELDVPYVVVARIRPSVTE